MALMRIKSAESRIHYKKKRPQRNGCNLGQLMMDWDCFLTGCTTFCCGNEDWGVRGNTWRKYFLVLSDVVVWDSLDPESPNFSQLFMYEECSKLCFACGFGGKGVHLTYGCNNFEYLILFSTTNCKRLFPPAFCLLWRTSHFYSHFQTASIPAVVNWFAVTAFVFQA